MQPAGQRRLGAGGAQALRGFEAGRRRTRLMGGKGRTAMHRFANPLRYQRIADRVLPWAGGATVVLLLLGLWLALFVAPPDYQQGEAYRIMFVHVPAAWMALMVYAMMAAASVVGLVWRHPLAEAAARAAAPIGAAFTAIALVTGSLWGKPMWGTYWVWDARLTSVLILFFLYLGYIALYEAFDDPHRGGRAASILCLVGSVNLPIIKFSVDWWNTLHQPSIFGMQGPTVDSSMLWPLFVMFGAFLCYFVAVHILRTRAELTERSIRNLRLAAEPAE
jgi:heme exporter protein C